MLESWSEDEKKWLVELIRSRLPNARILVFGSRVKNQHHKFSDLDLAIANGDEPVQQEIIEELREMIANSDIVYRVDLSDYFDMAPEFKNQIASHVVEW